MLAEGVIWDDTILLVTIVGVADTIDRQHGSWYSLIVLLELHFIHANHITHLYTRRSFLPFRCTGNPSGDCVGHYKLLF